MPSRKNCIWLCRENQINYWIDKLEENDYKICKIEIYGKPFKSRNALIPLPSDSYNMMCEKAAEYWNYKSEEDNEDDEYLYAGEFKILEIIDKNFFDANEQQKIRNEKEVKL